MLASLIFISLIPLILFLFFEFDNRKNQMLLENEQRNEAYIDNVKDSIDRFAGFEKQRMNMELQWFIMNPDPDRFSEILDRNRGEYRAYLKSVIIRANGEVAFSISDPLTERSRLFGLSISNDEGYIIEKKYDKNIFSEILLNGYDRVIVYRGEKVFFRGDGLSGMKESDILKNPELDTSLPEDFRVHVVNYNFAGNIFDSYTQMAFIVTLVLVFIIIIIAQNLSRFITSPLKVLTDHARNISEGRFEEISTYKYTKEIALLSSTFSDMGRRLDKLISDLNAEINKRRIMQKELENTLVELNESEKRYRAIAENSSDMIWITDSEFRGVYVSPCVKNMLGYDQSEFLQLDAVNYLTPNSLQVFMLAQKRIEDIEKARELRDNVFSITIQVEYIKKNREQLWTEISLSALFGKDGSFYQCIGITRDVDSRKKYERQLDRMNRELIKANKELKSLDQMKTNLLSNVSHELRTPLSSIRGYTQMLIDKSEDITQKRRKKLEIIYKNVEHLNFLIEEILSFTRLDLGKMALYIETFEIGELMEEVRDTIGFRIRKPKLRVNFNNQDIPLYTSADRTRIKQVLINIIDNAMKFSHNVGKVDVNIMHNRDEIIISVSDNGIGISEKDQAKIFDVFYQLDYTNTRQYQGLGLGLSIVKKILDLHETELLMVSRERVGTTVSFSLPFHNVQN